MAVVGNDNEMYANSHPFKVSIVEGGSTLVTELPETGTSGTMYVLVDDAENPTKAYGIYTYNNGWVLVAQPVDQAVQKVDELPEVGEEGILYYLAKEGDDTYDLYRWIDNSWIKVDTDIQLYSSEGDNTDGAMTQAATTALKGKARVLTTDDYNYPANNPIEVALWLLEPGMYYKADSSVKVYVAPNYSVSANTLAIVGTFDSDNDYTSIYLMNYNYYNGISSFLSLYVVRPDGTRYFSRNAEFAINGLTSNSITAPLSANQGRVLKNLIDSIAIRKAGAPTASTVGAIGTLYEDTTNGELYICTTVSGSTYTWKKVGFQYTAGEGLNLSASNEFSVDSTVVALKEDLPTTLTDVQYEDLWGEVEEQLTTVVSGTGA